MKDVTRKLKVKADRNPGDKKLRAVHDIIKLLEVNHAKADMALTEIKMLCNRANK